MPARLFKRRPDSHKGDYGRVLVIGGSPGLTGAVVLSARAALRCGAGLVTAAVPESLQQSVAARSLEVMTLPLPESRPGYLSMRALPLVEKVLEKTDVYVLGCGASQDPDSREFILALIKAAARPMVIDADALNALAGGLSVLSGRKNPGFVLTPHLGEFSRLINKDAALIKQQRKKLVRDFAGQYGLTLVLKGSHTLVSDGKTVYENNTGNPGMATAGSGDVLSGMIAGLMAQGLSGYDAAKYAVYLHGLAGDLAVKDKTQICLIASDIIEYLPKAIKTLA